MLPTSNMYSVVCKILQNIDIDLKEAVDLAENSVDTIKCLSINIDENFK